MSLEFLTTDAAVSDDRFKPVARTPMERSALAAGARFEIRGGWNVAVAYGTPEQEAAALRDSAGWADVSQLGKIELQGEADALRSIHAACAGGAAYELGKAARTPGAWWCPLSQTRMFVVCDQARLAELRDQIDAATASAPGRVTVLDLSTVFGAITIAGPLAREVFARFSALDLRPGATPVHSVRPGSIARQPAILIAEAQDRFTFLFGWGTGQYVWTVVADAAEHLGGRPVGVDALDPLDQPTGEHAEEVSADA